MFKVRNVAVLHKSIRRVYIEEFVLVTKRYYRKRKEVNEVKEICELQNDLKINFMVGKAICKKSVWSNGSNFSVQLFLIITSVTQFEFNSQLNFRIKKMKTV